MRIIGGMFGGRRFHPPAKMPARPTTDMAKEGLFNILQHMIDFGQMKSLDLFAGTGSISYELASRGCENLTLIEQDQRTVQFIQSMKQTLSLDGLRVYKMDVFTYIRQCSETYDFIFAGPPYALTEIDKIPDLVLDKPLLNPGGYFVLEHTPRNDYTSHPCFIRSKNYGTTVFSFFRLAQP